MYEYAHSYISRLDFAIHPLPPLWCSFHINSDLLYFFIAQHSIVCTLILRFFSVYCFVYFLYSSEGYDAVIGKSRYNTCNHEFYGLVSWGETDISQIITIIYNYKLETSCDGKKWSFIGVCTTKKSYLARMYKLEKASLKK